MKKLAKSFLIVLLFLVLLFLVYVLVTFPPIMGGMGAKTLCSCLFVSGRTEESVMAKELQVFPGLDKLNYSINREDSTVTAKLFWQTSKAIYREGLGCTLLAEASEEEVRSQRFNLHDRQFPRQDTIPWPTGDLHAVTASQHADRLAIERVLDDVFTEPDPQRPRNTHAVIVLYGGKIINERYADGFGPHSVFTGWSMTKSLTNALVGILVKQGKLKVTDPAPIEAWQRDERKNITIHHLLQASSGLAWSESYFLPGADCHNMFIHSDDKGGYAMTREIFHKPGTHFQYSSGTTNILSKIIRQTVGNSGYHRFPYDELFSKIGMHHALIEPDASGTFVASSYGFASARDWARLGLLYLKNGVWNGERILPEDWVRYSTAPAPAALRREYGAHLWLNLGEEGNPVNAKFPGLPNEAIIFSGFEDNFVVIIPSRDLVIVRLGVSHHDTFDIGELVTDIMEALPAPNNLAGTHD